jgi:hypothetical protein
MTLEGIAQKLTHYTCVVATIPKINIDRENYHYV